MKLTKRKGFNFFRSYFDVYNELENDADKVAFIDALLERQFMGKKPIDLKGMAKFAYISQTNSIDTQVKGYEDKTKTRLDGTPYYKEDLPPCQGDVDTPTVGGKNTPCQQEKEKVQEKVQGEVKEKEEDDEEEKVDDEDLIETTEKLKQIEVVYDKFVEEVKKGYHQQWAEATYMRLKIKKGSLTGLLKDFKNQLIIDSKIHANTKKLKEHLNNWLNKQEQIGKLNKHKTNPTGAL